ncbi:MAG: hypothetical protein V3S30_05400, partial [Thermoanaerobaculia bacterium]
FKGQNTHSKARTPVQRLKHQLSGQDTCVRVGARIALYAHDPRSPAISGGGAPRFSTYPTYAYGARHCVRPDLTGAYRNLFACS